MLNFDNTTDLELADQIQIQTSVEKDKRDSTWITTTNTLMSEWFHRKGKVLPPCYKDIPKPECYSGPNLYIVPREELIH